MNLAIGSLPQFLPLSRLVGYFCHAGLAGTYWFHQFVPFSEQFFKELITLVYVH